MCRILAGRRSSIPKGTDIQVRPVCKWRVTALLVLTYFKYAPLRFSEPTQFGRFAPVFDSDSA